MVKKIVLSLILFAFLLNFVVPYTTIAPTWLSSPYFRAGNNKVINKNTGNSSTPTYTFTFSSALTGIPNLAYGVKNYRGIFLLTCRDWSVERDELWNKKDRFDSKYIFSFYSIVRFRKFIFVGSTFYCNRSLISTSFE